MSTDGHQLWRILHGIACQVPLAGDQGAFGMGLDSKGLLLPT